MKIVFSLLVFLIISNLTLAQWSNDPTVNNPICTALYNQSFPQIISDGSGGAIVVWRDGLSGSLDIYIQRINSNGIVQWTLNGVAICTAVNNQYQTQLTTDGSGGAIITWTDRRNGSRTDIFAQRINSSGVVQWTTDGVSICTATMDQYDPQIISDGSGGAIITWEDHRDAIDYNPETDIYAQRINSDGTVQWTLDGVVISKTLDIGENKPRITTDGSGGAIITWEEIPEVLGNLDIYAQRINSTGIVQWATDGVAICTSTLDQSYQQLISDGNGGAIITWYDYDFSGEIDEDIYAQKVNTNGIVQWAVNGEAVCSAIDDQSYPQLVGDGNGGAIIVWRDKRNGNSFDIFSQRINSGGMVQWTPDGNAVCTSITEQAPPQLISDGSGGAIITWQEVLLFNSHNVYAQRISSNGLIQWAADGVAISTALLGQIDPQITRDNGGGAIITWYDSRLGVTNYDIYASQIDGNGNLGGSIWTPQVSGTTNYLWRVSFTDANTGTVVGQGGKILRTTNGGETWTSQTSGTTNYLFGVSFTDANTGTVVGDNGKVLRTTNGGTTWTSQIGGTVELYGVSFTDANNGTAVGNSGIILRTTNGGITWTAQSSPTPYLLKSVSFTDVNTGTAVGYFGTILRTTNGATTWISQTSGTTNHLHGVSFTDANTGTAVGNNGTILRTTDGGMMWSAQTSGTANSLLDVSFTDANTGTAVGNGGTILKTTNGGATWTSQTSGTTNHLHGVSFTDANTGTAVGEYGTILRTQINSPSIIGLVMPNGGENWQVDGTYEINWNSVNVSNVKIDYTTDNGSSWLPIISSTPSDGSFSWTIPNTPSTQCKVRITDVANSSVSDESDNLFSISEGGSITLVSPNGGENWQVDGTYEITWNSTNVANVKIDYTTNNGTSWLPITPSTPSDGSYSWTIPNTPSTLCKVKITDVSNPTINDVSDNMFKIVFRIPVIFIPGIMGSPLFNDENYSNTLYRNPFLFSIDEFIWADALQLGLPYDEFLDVLALNNDGITSPNNIKVAPLWGDGGETIEELLDVYPLSYYKDLILVLESDPNFYQLDNFDIVHNPSENLYIFTYDWRKNILNSADELSSLIENILAWNNVDKVNLICHSMGGLIAKKYINESTSDKINKIIFVATPHLGAPKILSTLATGELFGLMDPVCNNDEIKYISRNMPSAYLLMPSSIYTDINYNNGQNTQDLDLYKYTFRYPTNVNATYQQMLDFYSNITLPGGFTFNSYLINQEHIERQLIENISFGDIDVYNVVGFGERTIGKVKYWKPFGIDKFDEDWNLTGDGTVPLRSAEIVNFNKKKADFYIKEEKHSALPSSEAGRGIIQGLLREPAAYFSMPNKIYSDPPESYALSLWQAFAGSPVSLHAYDSQGNHTGSLTDTTWEENIPHSEYFHGDLRDPSSSKGILLPPDNNYYFVINSLDTTDNFDLIIEKIIDGNNLATLYFDSVVIQNQTEALCSLSTNVQNINLEMDYNGDGTIDSTILPTIADFCHIDSVEQGWNLISIPFLSDVKLKVDLFPEAVSNAYWFNGGYVIKDTIEVRKGYWLKFDNAYLHLLCGQVAMDTIHIKTGWNLIGCFNKDAPIVNIGTDPPGILNSNFYGYSGSYTIPDTLKIGKGYWIKASQDGVLNLNQSLNKTFHNNITIDQDWSNIIISDSKPREMKLYFAEVENPEHYQLPPLPPSGAFDIRFDSGTMVENLSEGDKLINISGATYPIRIKTIGTNISVRDVINGNILNQTLLDGDEIIIYDSRIDKILIIGENKIEIPISYNLEQNYPNPFNPNTIIKFSIAKEVKVNLSVYNILGEKVKELKNEIVKPGFYQVEFNASNYASGIYIYRIKAGNFVESKKMILLK